ncbi:MAG TPA: discoidin domain-containing protein [Phnomibacter sp.]|nr:discoidin domain-containing protein [Phnomibacter sp.]
MDDKGNILNTITQTFALHKAVGKPVTLSIAPASKYSGNGGVQGLVNGASSQKGLNSAEWVGWQGGNLDATIDLQQMQTINQVVVHAYESRGSWIYRPQEIIVETSADGKSFNETGRLNVDMNIPESQLRQLVVPIANVQAQYLRVKAINFGTIPAGMAGASHPAWLFVDEIEVL